TRLQRIQGILPGRVAIRPSFVHPQNVAHFIGHLSRPEQNSPKSPEQTVLPHFRCNLETGRRIFLESREPLYDTQDWGFVACGGSSGDLAWSLSKRDRIPPRSFWSWKARP